MTTDDADGYVVIGNHEVGSEVWVIPAQLTKTEPKQHWPLYPYTQPITTDRGIGTTTFKVYYNHGYTDTTDDVCVHRWTYNGDDQYCDECGLSAR